MVKKEAKIAKTAMYIRNNFSKIGNYSVHMGEFCYFDRPERTEYYSVRSLSIQNNIPYAHLSVWNIPKKSVRNILPYAQHPPTVPRYVPVLCNAQQNSEQFFRSVELGTRKMGILLLEPLKSSGSNPKK